jgi:hypothetical protein
LRLPAIGLLEGISLRPMHQHDVRCQTDLELLQM